LIRADVLIFGAGPAGAVAALNLAPTWRVILVERKAQAVRRIGEALPWLASRSRAIRRMANVAQP